MMSHIYTHLPPKEVSDAYEEMKFAYQDKLNQIIQGQLKRMVDKEKGLDVLTPVEKRMFELYSQKKPFMEIYEEMGMTHTKGKAVLDMTLLKLGIEKTFHSMSRDSVHVLERDARGRLLPKKKQGSELAEVLGRGDVEIYPE